MSQNTYVARLTPAGTAAIASFAVWGPEAWNIVTRLFAPRSPKQRPLPGEPSFGRIWYGRLGEQVADEVVVTAKAISDFPQVEIHCHGGKEAQRLIEELLLAQGATVCTWQKLAELQDRNVLRRQAALALVQAPTLRTAKILLDQYQGALEQALEEIRQLWERGQGDLVLLRLGELLLHGDLGLHLTAPWKVVIAGPPNVGKSSLINALAGYERSIVADTPGTTRDLVRTYLAVDGWPVEFIDTAGQRETGNDLESQGVGLAQEAMKQADLCLWLLDASAGPVRQETSFPRLHLVINKIDLVPAWELAQFPEAAPVSAATGQGISDLCRQIGQWLVPNPPPAGTAVPFTAGIGSALQGMISLLQAGSNAEARRMFDWAWCGQMSERM
jgi:tRNA modification GTPase